MKVNPKNMVRKEKYSVERVLSIASKFVDRSKKDPETRMDFDGDTMKMASDRYKCFAVSGTTCVSCGVEGQYFYKEKDHSQEREVYHFNLYGIDKNGNEVQMTKDHIIPRSKGGANHVSNYQTMCSDCNEAKGDRIAS
jgi:5-methylcytosine-specific restriction endonuclease McrA